MTQIVTDLIVTIDPGANGAIAMQDAHGLRVFKMPRETARLLPLFEDYKATHRNVLVFIERVGMYTADTGGKQFGIVKMLANYEGVKAMLAVARWTYIQVYPQTWQSVYRKETKGMDKTQRKGIYKAHAQQLYPGVHVTLQNADALLLLDFATRKLNHDTQWVLAQLPNKQKQMF